MRSLLLPILLAACITSTAQTIKYETMILTDTSDADWESTYPLFTSATNPKAAAAINKALQISDFQKIRTLKNPNALRRNAQEQYWVWHFNVTRPSPKLIEVSTFKTILAFGMQSAPYDQAYQYFFDAETGDRIYPSDLFVKEGYMNAWKLAEAGLYQSMAENKKGIIAVTFKELLEDAFGDTFDKDCKDDIKNKWANELTRMILKPATTTFYVDDCENGIPRRNHATYATTINNDKLTLYFSDTWKYYMAQGQPVNQDHPSHLWVGTLGAKTPLSFLLKARSDGSVEGFEVYDNYGGTIQLKGTFDNGSNTLKLDEIEKEKVLATYTVTIQNAKLTGTWTKADGSKSMPVVMTVAGQP